MSKESYARGFVKAAQAMGVDHVDLVKYAYPKLVFDPVKGRYVVESSDRGQEIVRKDLENAMIPIFRNGWYRNFHVDPIDDAETSWILKSYPAVTNETGIYHVPNSAFMDGAKGKLDWLRKTAPSRTLHMGKRRYQFVQGGEAGVTNSPNATMDMTAANGLGVSKAPIWQRVTRGDGASVNIPASIDVDDYLHHLANKK
jgi:hypothetical protein